MTIPVQRTATIASVTLFAVSFLGACTSSDSGGESVAEVPVVSSPTQGTLGELDDVVVTVAPDDLAGDPIVIGDSGTDGATQSPTGIEPEGAGIDSRPVEGELNPLGGDDPEDGRMPDVVCMGLQDAQDEIQDHGVFFSKSEDASGDGRRQLFDRNWIVVAQSPAPGEEIGEGEAVLSVVKTNEDNDC